MPKLRLLYKIVDTYDYYFNYNKLQLLHHLGSLPQYYDECYEFGYTYYMDLLKKFAIQLLQ